MAMQNPWPCEGIHWADPVLNSWKLRMEGAGLRDWVQVESAVKYYTPCTITIYSLSVF